MRLTGLHLLALLCSWLAPPPALADPPEQENLQQDSQLVAIPFDFQSNFDQGRYGRMIGDMIWKKLERRGGFIIPESMLDVRDWSQRRRTLPSPDTPLGQMKQYVVDELGADVAIWGKVERVAGFDVDVYDLWILVADFSAAEPRMLVQIKARTKTVSEIPHVYVKQALDRLYGSSPEPLAQADPQAEQRWQQGPNLVQGDFEQGTPHPAGWDPLPRYVSLVTIHGESAARSRVIRFQFPKAVAATTGVLYYSHYFPVQEGARYRFQCRWRSTGSAVKVFIKCYDELPTRYAEKDSGASSQRREVYRSQQNLKGPPKSWNLHTEDFTPQHTQFTPRWGRVMLYAYWPAGAVDFDNVVVKQIVPPPSGQPPKVRRPSLETKVLSDEVERASDK